MPYTLFDTHLGAEGLEPLRLLQTPIRGSHVQRTILNHTRGYWGKRHVKMCVAPQAKDSGPISIAELFSSRIAITLDMQTR